MVSVDEAPVIKATRENILLVYELIRYVFLLGGFPIFRVEIGDQEASAELKDKEAVSKYKQALNLNKIMILFTNKYNAQNISESG